jgi:hypothetical protein
LREEHRLRVFENRVVRRTYEPKRDEIIGGWRKLLNDEHHNLYSSPNIIRMMKSRRMRWAGHVTHVAEKRNTYSILLRKPEGKTRVEDLDTGRWIQKWILEKQAAGHGLNSSGSGWRAVASSC